MAPRRAIRVWREGAREVAGWALSPVGPGGGLLPFFFICFVLFYLFPFYYFFLSVFFLSFIIIISLILSFYIYILLILVMNR